MVNTDTIDIESIFLEMALEENDPEKIFSNNLKSFDKMDEFKKDIETIKKLISEYKGDKNQLKREIEKSLKNFDYNNWKEEFKQIRTLILEPIKNEFENLLENIINFKKGN